MRNGFCSVMQDESDVANSTRSLMKDSISEKAEDALGLKVAEDAQGVNDSLSEDLVPLSNVSSSSLSTVSSSSLSTDNAFLDNALSTVSLDNAFLDNPLSTVSLDNAFPDNALSTVSLDNPLSTVSLDNPLSTVSLDNSLKVEGSVLDIGQEGWVKQEIITKGSRKWEPLNRMELPLIALEPDVHGIANQLVKWPDPLYKNTAIQDFDGVEHGLDLILETLLQLREYTM